MIKEAGAPLTALHSKELLCFVFYTVVCGAEEE
jgi:hypothetical protein